MVEAIGRKQRQNFLADFLKGRAVGRGEGGHPQGREQRSWWPGRQATGGGGPHSESLGLRVTVPEAEVLQGALHADHQHCGCPGSRGLQSEL